MTYTVTVSKNNVRFSFDDATFDALKTRIDFSNLLDTPTIDTFHVTSAFNPKNRNVYSWLFANTDLARKTARKLRAILAKVAK